MFENSDEMPRQPTDTNSQDDEVPIPLDSSSSDSSQSQSKRKSTTMGGIPEKHHWGGGSWDTMVLKGDLLVAKAKIHTLELQANQQLFIQNDLEVQLKKEKTYAAEQQKKHESAIAKMKDNIEIIQKREQDIKASLFELRITNTNNKYKLEKENLELQMNIAELKRKQFDSNTSNYCQMAEVRRDMDALVANLQTVQSENEMLKKQLAIQTVKADECIIVNNKLDKQTFEFNQLVTQLQEFENDSNNSSKYKKQAMEFENDSNNSSEYKKQAMKAHKRLANMAELEKEVKELRATERLLRDNIPNKLQLEEKVRSLSAKLLSQQPIQEELHETKIKLASLEATVDEWTSAARKYGVNNPQEFTTALKAALQNEIKAVKELTQNQTQLATVTEEASTMESERNKVVTKLNELLVVYKNQQRLIAQLRTVLIHERDSYRKKLNCHQNEVSGSEREAGSDALMMMRVKLLEKCVHNYRSLLAKYDTNNSCEILKKLTAEVAKWRDEALSLRRDCSMLRSQRDDLQMQMERLNHSANKTKVSLLDSASQKKPKDVAATLQQQQQQQQPSDGSRRLREAYKSSGQKKKSKDARFKL